MKAPVQKIPATTPLATLHQHGAWSPLMRCRWSTLEARSSASSATRRSERPLRRSRTAHGATTALTTLLDLGEVYWSGLFSAIEVLAEGGTNA